MKKIKIFPKTFLYTLGLMLFIIAIAHVLLYLFTPQVMIDVSITPHEEWSLSTGFNVEQYVKQTIIKVLSFSSVCCIIISVICWFWFSRKITIPIKHIQTMTEQMRWHEWKRMLSVLSTPKMKLAFYLTISIAYIKVYCQQLIILKLKNRM